MADCSLTVEFFKERDRMCDSSECEDCPIYRDNNGRREHCDYFCAKYTDEAVQIVQKWSYEHPLPKLKTYADVFFEKFPNAPKLDNGMPDVCRKKIFGSGDKCMKHSWMYAKEICMACWNEPYEDEENG